MRTEERSCFMKECKHLGIPIPPALGGSFGQVSTPWLMRTLTAGCLPCSSLVLANCNQTTSSEFTSALTYWDNSDGIDIVWERHWLVQDLKRYCFPAICLYIAGASVIITMKWEFGLGILQITQFHCIIGAPSALLYSLTFRVKFAINKGLLYSTAGHCGATNKEKEIFVLWFVKIKFLK